MFFPKDFIETAEGLLFAVVDSHQEQDKVLCFLRYINSGGRWLKQATHEANAFLRAHHPYYLHHSAQLDAELHAVGAYRIVSHHQPRVRLKAILQQSAQDPVEHDLTVLCGLLRRQGIDPEGVGITGSVLVGAQTASSDIDLVCYGQEVFQACRESVKGLIDHRLLQPLSENDWQESFRRRACSLSYDDYVWHEKRKFNKALVNGRKFDLSLVSPAAPAARQACCKLGPITLTCRIADAEHAFDYPSVYRIEHDSIAAVVCFTATYTGQALYGECVEVSGMLEENAAGERRIVVGSSREAHGEYMRVMRD